MGFVHIISHAVLFGPDQYGGYGITKLFTEQGLGAIKLLLGHLQSKSEVLQVVLLLLYFLKLHCGIQKLHLECFNCKVPYVPLKRQDRRSSVSLTISLWIAKLRKFLANFSSSIYIANTWNPQTQRQHNYFIMVM